MGELQKNHNPYKKRQAELILKIALAADCKPLLASGLWFHNDVRNNFYYASYLFAAAVDSSLEISFDRENAKRKAEDVLLETLMLQNCQPGTARYGHWPLGLNPLPREAAPHELPVEIMGSLMAYFHREYGKLMNDDLSGAFDTAMEHIYRSDFFRKPVVTYGHHEAKYTAAKLIFGGMFKDEELLEDGRQCLKQTLEHIRSKGMPEYGSLPWFWHWVQAFTCALEFADGEDTELQSSLREMLDYLWNERSQFYLKGAWVGAHSRGWPHDVPGDVNVLHDYVQFGDFKLPEAMPRTEYAGFMFYEAPEEARVTALNHRIPVEIKKMTEKVVPTDPNRQPQLHSYAYITEEFAAGGMWERVEEFDNEQLRWAFSLPVNGEGGANQLFFFHPGERYKEGDPRHQSRYAEVLYYQNVIMALYPVPAGEPNQLIGVLPKGTWIQQSTALYGQVDYVYFAIYLSHPYELNEREKYTEVTVEGMPGGVVIEAVSVKDATELGIDNLDQYAELMKSKAPDFRNSSTDSLESLYSNLKGDELHLTVGVKDDSRASINGNRELFEDYLV